MPKIFSIFLPLSSAPESKQNQTPAEHSGWQRAFKILAFGQF